MEGPTPVPALIHAATTVTAGVYLIIRCSFLFEFSSFCLEILVYISSLTILIFGIIGCFQYDIKKIIAFSTCSQLGYMVLSCGLSGYNYALFHLVNHASFKALLSLAAGSIIHVMNNEQDIRKLSGIFFKETWLSTFFLIGTLALVGIPFFSGYYSKDLIINLSFFYKNKLIFILANFGVFLTGIYSFRLIYFLLIKENFNFKYNSVSYISTFKFNNFFPLFCLTVTSIIGGFFLKNIFSSPNIFIFNGSIFISSNHFFIL
jgi:NADH:ubiquinone oxidoreductase subunit 5 (subunit L)/multisubunit Na+/H+ antiporter MnhA subunit